MYRAVSGPSDLRLKGKQAMRTKNDIHNLYDIYVASCEEFNEEPLDYDEWLEQMLIQSDVDNEMMADERDCHRHAAEVNHCAYVRERNKREAYEASLLTVGFNLEHGQIDTARRVALHVGIFN